MSRLLLLLLQLRKTIIALLFVLYALRSIPSCIHSEEEVGMKIEEVAFAVFNALPPFDQSGENVFAQSVEMNTSRLSYLYATGLDACEYQNVINGFCAEVKSTSGNAR